MQIPEVNPLDEKAMAVEKEQVEEILSKVIHPDLRKNIVELGMVHGLTCSEGKIRFTIRLLANNDPFGQSLLRASRRALVAAFGEGITIEADVVSGDAIPKPKDAHKLGGVARVKRIVAVASGKGGVGKSTVTVNVAVALARQGYSVGILDADVHGPSMPLMLGLTDEHPEVHKEGDENLIKPLEAYGVKMLSMGFFVNANDALVWRGPMASNALKQLITMGEWGELDFLLLDMPPGTSDIQLTVVQDLKLTGAIIVTTPQRVALADAEKAISMFSGEQVRVPILGIVENMAWFEPEELKGHKYYLFGKEGGKRLAEERGVPLLGQVPIVQSIREGGDTGCPVAADSSVLAGAFDGIANALRQNIEYNEALQYQEGM